MTLSDKVRQVQPQPPSLLVPMEAAVTPPTAQNKPLPGEDVKAAKAIDSIQATPLNPCSKEAKGMEISLQSGRDFFVRAPTS